MSIKYCIFNIIIRVISDIAKHLPAELLNKAKNDKKAENKGLT